MPWGSWHNLETEEIRSYAQTSSASGSESAFDPVPGFEIEAADRGTSWASSASGSMNTPIKATRRRVPAFGPGDADLHPSRRARQGRLVSRHRLERPSAGFNKILPGVQARNGLTCADRNLHADFVPKDVRSGSLPLMLLPDLHLCEGLPVEAPRNKSCAAYVASKECSSAHVRGGCSSLNPEAVS